MNDNLFIVVTILDTNRYILNSHTFLGWREEIFFVPLDLPLSSVPASTAYLADLTWLLTTFLYLAWNGIYYHNQSFHNFIKAGSSFLTWSMKYRCHYFSWQIIIATWEAHLNLLRLTWYILYHIKKTRFLCGISLWGLASIVLKIQKLVPTHYNIVLPCILRLKD